MSEFGRQTQAGKTTDPRAARMDEHWNDTDGTRARDRDDSRLYGYGASRGKLAGMHNGREGQPERWDGQGSKRGRRGLIVEMGPEQLMALVTGARAA